MHVAGTERWAGHRDGVRHPPAFRALLPLALLLCASCTLPGAEHTGYEERWLRSDNALLSERTVPVFRARLALTGSWRFARLPAALRHDRLLSTAVLGEELQQDGQAHRLFVLASRLPAAGFDDWDGRLVTASRLADTLDVTRSLAHIVRSWPLALSSYSTRFILESASRRASSPEEGVAGFELRLALYQVRFRQDHPDAPGGLWALLARDLLERHRAAEALEVVSRINTPRALLSLRIDRRFDGLVRRSPARFDVLAAARRQVGDCERAVAQQPRSLEALVHLTYAYLDAGRHPDILRVVGTVLARVQDGDSFHAAYDDDDTALNWLLDSYARALMATQPWPDARGVLETAAQGLEHGHPNVSNVINLGGFYARLGRPDKALRVLAQIPDDAVELSPYGRMQRQEARLIAAVVRKDPVLIREALAYLRAHQDDAIQTWQDALLWAGRDEEAARLLITRLRDPQRRVDALLAVQRYCEPSAPPRVMQHRERWRQLIARREVRHAILRVGHIDNIPLPPEDE